MARWKGAFTTWKFAYAVAASHCGAMCVFCGKPFTHAFRAREVFFGLTVAALSIWGLIPCIGPIIIPVALSASFFAGMHLENWH